MEKKEFYKHVLPHFQVPGQAYFVTWILKDEVPRKALKFYSDKLKIIKSELDFSKLKAKELKGDKALVEKYQNEIGRLKGEYYNLKRKYLKAYEDLLHNNKKPTVDLSKSQNLEIIKEALFFWDGEKLTNFAFCVMPNHVHWVFQLQMEDKYDKLVYLQDIMHSIKRFTSNKINKAEYRKGVLWQKESFDTTIRDECHLYNVIEYTLNNPVIARLVNNRDDWRGSMDFKRF